MYVAGDITKDEYQTIKNSVVISTPPTDETVDMAALKGVINVQAQAWEHARPEERYARNKLLLKWIRMTKKEIVEYELTDLAKVLFEE